MSRRPTLHEVANLAGASLASTSRALNGMGASPEMIEKVRAAAEQLGYHPDAAGRSLRMGRTFQVGFAVADIGNPVYVDMMKAIHEVVGPQGYHVVVATTGNDVESTADVIRSLASGVVDGLVISPLRSDETLAAQMEQAPVPVVVVGRVPQNTTLDSVWADSAAGIGMAVDQLVGVGRRRLLFLNGPLGTTPASHRLQGFEDALARHDLTAAGMVVADDFTVEAGTRAVDGLLDDPAAEGPDAIVAANDLLAIGCIQALRRRNVRVPDDIAVTGMDDTEIAAVFSPSLTSVALGSRERGRAAAELLLRRIAGESGPAQRVHVAPRLVVRESSGGPA
ncbi:LacI family DNA-binding transcriptional regulator [Cellulomonas sp. SG140]|uniref:LacI family DNA-binding transcriptional regulator n=1 Tax=Cellulomonas sp. SG140 TaxID=2976536 RepID=UPI0021E7B4B1|nr:LacI family DNA-binding transcriptional regulator [Cellulomonas sp. SG140]